jgi:hypothetical protein
MSNNIARHKAAQAVVDELVQNGNRLGVTQRGVLRALLEHRAYPSAWVWDTPAGTVRVLNGLVKRGLVQDMSRRSDLPTREFDQLRYEPTPRLQARMARYLLSV